MSTQLSVREQLDSDVVRNQLINRLGKEKAESFIMSALTVIQDSTLLQKADARTVINGVAKAASINLPLDGNRGFAYLVPFKNSKLGIVEAQFQIGARGFKELAYRTKKYKRIEFGKVVEGEMKQIDRLTGEIEWEWVQDQDERNTKPVVGYFGFYETHSGMRKTLYMTKKELLSHGKKYSQSFKKGYGLWKDDFDAMAIKTVVKQLLGKDAQLTEAYDADQAVLRDDGVDYPDNAKMPLEENNETKEKARLIKWINEAQDEKTLAKANVAVYDMGDDKLIDLFEDKARELAEAVDISA